LNAAYAVVLVAIYRSKDEYIYKNLQICYDLNKAASNIGNMQKIEKLMKQLDM